MNRLPGSQRESTIKFLKLLRILIYWAFGPQNTFLVEELRRYKLAVRSYPDLWTYSCMPLNSTGKLRYSREHIWNFSFLPDLQQTELLLWNSWLSRLSRWKELEERISTPALPLRISVCMDSSSRGATVLLQHATFANRGPESGIPVWMFEQDYRYKAGSQGNPGMSS